jgi:hypothetical protein
LATSPINQSVTFLASSACVDLWAFLEPIWHISLCIGADTVTISWRPDHETWENFIKFITSCSEWPYTVSSVFLNTLLTLLSSFYLMKSSISTLFLSQQTVAIRFLAGRCYLTSLACFANVCASTALTALWFQHSQMKPRFHHLLIIQWEWEIHSHLRGTVLKMSKLKPFSAFCVHMQPFLRPMLCRTCHSLALLWYPCREHCMKSVETRMKFLSLWSAIFHTSLFWFNLKEADNSTNFAAGSFNNRGKHYN